MEYDNNNIEYSHISKHYQQTYWGVFLLAFMPATSCMKVAGPRLLCDRLMACTAALPAMAPTLTDPVSSMLHGFRDLGREVEGW